MFHGGPWQAAARLNKYLQSGFGIGFVLYFSVQWWNTLHQGASVSLNKAPSMAATMLAGMLVMAFASWAYTLAVVLWRVRPMILERERHTEWVGAELERVGGAGAQLGGGRA